MPAAHQTHHAARMYNFTTKVTAKSMASRTRTFWRMPAQIGSEVPEPINFSGLGSEDQLAYKVDEPDRLMLGMRIEKHLRQAVCNWRSLVFPGGCTDGVETFPPLLCSGSQLRQWTTYNLSILPRCEDLMSLTKLPKCTEDEPRGARSRPSFDATVVHSKKG